MRRRVLRVLRSGQKRGPERIQRIAVSPNRSHGTPVEVVVLGVEAGDPRIRRHKAPYGEQPDRVDEVQAVLKRYTTQCLFVLLDPGGVPEQGGRRLIRRAEGAVHRTVVLHLAEVRRVEGAVERRRRGSAEL